MLSLLHLCDSLFPIGGFAYSDGLEAAAAATSAISDIGALRDWMDACLDETMGRLEGPAVWQAWAAFRLEDWHALKELDEELDALRPAASVRRSTRTMGLRLLITWRALHPDPRLETAEALARAGRLGPALAIAFAAACAVSGIQRRPAVEAFAYTRLAATVSAAMRLMPVGQTDAHRLLARTLDRLPAVVDGIIERDGRIESFSPALDIAAMTQQYLHSRLFRS
jgi:urease accessory protein